MANWIPKGVAIASSTDPPFAPCLTPKLPEQPWLLEDSDRAAARTKWPSFPKQAERPLLPPELIIQAFTLYQLRFISASDLCRAWPKFGGLGPQLARLSAVLHIGVAENVGDAMENRRIARTRLQGKARMGGGFLLRIRGRSIGGNLYAQRTS